MRLSRLTLPHLLALLSLPCFLASLPVPPQNPPSDAAEISRDLLFLAPTRIEPLPMLETSSRYRFFAGRFIYTEAGPGEAPPRSAAGLSFPGWIVTLAKDPLPVFGSGGARKLSFVMGGEDYTITGRSDDDRSTLDLSRTGAPEPIITAVLWTRAQLAAPWLPVLKRHKRGLTAASLQQDLEVADPVIYAVEPAGDSLWVGLGHSAGEGELGLGTVVRFDIKEKQARVFQPPELATCDVTQISVVGADALVLGTRRWYEKTVEPCAGPVRFRPTTGKSEKLSVGGTPLENTITTALNQGWVATDEGICRILGGAVMGCLRIIPSVALKAPVTVFNKPGEKSGSELKPGDYEVLWANQSFLEIATKDSYDAWLAADDYAEAAARNFDAEPYKLLNTSTGFSPIRPLMKPAGEPLEGTLVFRAPLEKRETPQGTPAGWVKVRIHAGWIERGSLEVVPKLVPVEK